jgi:putative tryptophan/tyrosine transport system substrate-binding protein
MRRREFVIMLGGAAAAWPLLVSAQQRPVPVVGFLNAASPDGYAPMVAAFRQGLNEIGFVEGQNVTIEYRWAEGQYGRLPTLAADLVGRRVAVIAATGGSPSALAVRTATTTIPIVFTTGDDPVQAGLVASLNRPGGNITGVTTLNMEVGPKRLELLHELMPAATIIALLVNPTSPALAEQSIRDSQTAARILGLELRVLNASTEREIDGAFETLVQLRANGLVIGTDNYFIGRSEQFAALALRHAVPAISSYREFAASGGLMSYGGDFTDTYRLAGVYAGRILRGDKPADLPVQQATKVQLVINMKTAKALSLTFPITLLGRADEAIE